jgi:hypothetical protein
MTTIKIADQGKVVIEPDCGGFLIMLPDGNVVWKETRRLAEGVARRWFKTHLAKGNIGVGEIEWRTLADIEDQI